MKNPRPAFASGSPVLRSSVPVHEKNRTLAEYLAARFTYHERQEWERLISAGNVLLNGERCASGTPLSPDDEIAYTPEPFEEPPADLNFSVVYEDEWLLGINKTGNLLVHRAGKSFRSNLIYQLRYGDRTVQYPDAGMVNRLDRETSGVVLAGKNDMIVATMHGFFRDNLMDKEYIAVVAGVPDPSIRMIDAPIGPDRAEQVRCMHHVDPQHGKAAQTEVLHVQPIGGGCSVVRVRPITGRTHQVRVHLAHIGCPVIGDKLYAGTPSGAQVSLNRQALHCARLAFDHPYLKQRVEITAPLPDDIAGLIEQLSCSEDRVETTRS